MENLLIKILQNGNIADATIAKYLRYLNIFESAFAHKSYEGHTDSELLKFIGDPSLDMCVIDYIHQRFPTLHDQRWMTHIRHSITSKGLFAKYAEELGFWEYIKYGGYYTISLEASEDKQTNKKYHELLDSTLRSVLGALITISNKLFATGFGNTLVYNFLTYYLNGQDIGIGYEDIFDAKTRLNNLYRVMNWPSKNIYRTDQINEEDEKPLFQATVSGTPKGNPMILAIATNHSKAEAEQDAAQSALNYLKNHFKIAVADKYPHFLRELPHAFIPPIFKSFIQIFLNQFMPKEYVHNITQDGNMVRFMLAFTHPSYDKINNYEVLEFHGDGVVNMCIAQYIRKTLPQVINIKWVTRIKHNLISKQNLSQLAHSVGFFDHIYRKNVTDTTSMLEDVFEAFFGALVENIRSIYSYAAGYAIAYNIISYLLGQVPISLKPEDVFDPKSLLKEIYDRNGWDWKSMYNVKQRYLGYNRDIPSGYNITLWGMEGDKKVKLVDQYVADLTTGEREVALKGLIILKQRYGMDIEIGLPTEISKK
jgi:ribonuclease-3